MLARVFETKLATASHTRRSHGISFWPRLNARCHVVGHRLRRCRVPPLSSPLLLSRSLSSLCCSARVCVRVQRPHRKQRRSREHVAPDHRATAHGTAENVATQHKQATRGSNSQRNTRTHAARTHQQRTSRHKAAATPLDVQTRTCRTRAKHSCLLDFDRPLPNSVTSASFSPSQTTMSSASSTPIASATVAAPSAAPAVAGAVAKTTGSGPADGKQSNANKAYSRMLGSASQNKHYHARQACMHA